FGSVITLIVAVLLRLGGVLSAGALSFSRHDILFPTDDVSYRQRKSRRYHRRDRACPKFRRGINATYRWRSWRFAPSSLPRVVQPSSTYLVDGFDLRARRDSRVAVFAIGILPEKRFGRKGVVGRISRLYGAG